MGALFQGKPPTPLCPLTDPGWKSGGSKSVMEAAATPHASKLTHVASTPTIAARGAAERVLRLERRTAITSPNNNVTQASPYSGELDRPYPRSVESVN